MFNVYTFIVHTISVIRGHNNHSNGVLLIYNHSIYKLCGKQPGTGTMSAIGPQADWVQNLVNISAENQTINFLPFE
jgi:hypothetical protein